MGELHNSLVNATQMMNADKGITHNWLLPNIVPGIQEHFLDNAAH